MQFINLFKYLIAIIFLIGNVIVYAYSFDTLKYKTYVDSLSKWSYHSPNKAVTIGKELYVYTEKINDLASNESVLNSLSLAYYYMGNRKESLLYLNILKNLYYKQNNFDKLSLIYNRIGAIYQDWSLYTEALNSFNKAYKYALKSKNQSRIAQCYNNLGLINKEQGNYDKAFDYFIKAKEVYIQLNDKRNLAFTLNNIGIIYKRIKSFDKALSYFLQSIELKKSIGDIRTLPNSYGNIAELYIDQGDYTNAEKWFKESLILRTQNNDQENIIRDLLALLRIYTLTNNLPKAKEYLSEVELKLKNNSSILDIRRNYYETISLFYEKSKDFKNAFIYFKKAKELSDSIFNEETAHKALELEYIVNSEQKEQEINELRLENQKSLEKLRNELTFKYILLIILVSVFSILLILFIRYKIGLKARLAIEEKNIHIEKINEELITVNDELEQRVKERTEELEKEMQIKEETLQKLEIALKKAEESNYLKDAFLANINHEIRTPLSAIIGLTEVLKSRISNTNPEIEKFVDGIAQSSNRLFNLLNNIIDLSRVQANDIIPHIDSCNPNQLVRKVGDLFVFRINEKKLELSYILGEVPKMKCDKDLTFKVLVDILDNAVKYTEKGKIEISTSVISNGKEVMISVSDTGIGIDESYLPNVFETFRQESMGYNRLYQGAGLGLPLSQRMIKLMGGRLELSSKKNFGTTVNIILPASEVNIEKQTTPSFVQDNKDIPDAKILLVEDDDFNALYIKTIVESVAMVDWVKDGNEAISIIEKSKKPYDIVILDINLPNQWEGISLQKEIRKKFPEYNNVPFVAQTAYSFNTDKEKILNNGFVEYFTKPLNSEHFLNSIKFLLINNSKK
ncbi:MAG: tetratricopeptide repeat protein [Bacteroidales bacterium]|nr:tetratricopeptide repeat protein [Bacteroidales bacterium]